MMAEREGKRASEAVASRRSASLPKCSEAEKEEAKALIREITAHSYLDPNELIAAGVRADVIRVCYEELGLRRDVLEEELASASSGDGQRAESEVAPAHSESAPVAPRNALDQRMLELQHRTAVLEEQHRLLEEQRAKEKLLATNVPAEEATSAESEQTGDFSGVSSVDAMRQAAIASMKRKRALPHQERELAAAIPSRPPDPPPNAPKGPRQQKRYRDVDAPSQSVRSAEEEAAMAMMEAEADVPQPDHRNVSHSRRANLVYGDEFPGGLSAPSGQVDFLAPLPHLEVVRNGSLPSRPSSAEPFSAALSTSEADDNAALHHDEYRRPIRRGRKRRSFLPQGTQRVEIAFSDDSSDDEEAPESETDDGKQRRAIRAQNTSFIHAAWRKEHGLDDSSMPASPLTPNTQATSTRSKEAAEGDALLRRKEEEIEALKRKMKELEKRRQGPNGASEAKPPTKNESPVPRPAKKASSPTKGKHDKSKEAERGSASTLSKGEDRKEKDATERDEAKAAEEDSGASDFPAYSSVFAKYPGLRSLLE